MNRSTYQSKPSSSTADLPAAFQIDELAEGNPDAAGMAGLLEQAQRACEGLIRQVHHLRVAGQQGQVWQEQADTARRRAEHLMAEAGRLQRELAMAQRSLADQAQQAQQAQEALYCRFAGEAFRFQQMVAHLQQRGLDARLGKEFDRVRILYRRMERLLHSEDVHILDPTGSEPDGEQVDVMSYVVRPEVEADTIIETLEPIVAQAGRIISRGKVVVAVPPTD
jgi:molecular chaperone GrpE (heat shock protein)